VAARRTGEGHIPHSPAGAFAAAPAAV